MAGGAFTSRFSGASGGTDPNAQYLGIVTAYNASTKEAFVRVGYLGSSMRIQNIFGPPGVTGPLMVGDTVVVCFLNGHINEPVIIARINSSAATPSVAVEGTLTARPSAGQDGVVLAGRTGGSSSYDVTLTPTTLTADRTLTLPNVSGTVITTGDTGTVTSAMILDGTIVNGDINASAAIADTKLATISTAGKVSNSATTATSSNTASAIVARDASGNFTAGTITATLSGNSSTTTLATKASTLARDGGNGTAMTFNWNGQGGQPSWLWGSNDGTNIYVWNPSNFSVNYASSAGSASSASTASSAAGSSVTEFQSSRFRGTESYAGSYHSQQAIQSGQGGSMAGVAIWASGVAPQLRVGSGNNTVYFRNADDAIYVPIAAIIYDQSSLHSKQDINTFPKMVQSVGAQINEDELYTGLNIARKLRPVTFRWKEDGHFNQVPLSPRRAYALSRLNEYRKTQGLGPYQSDELIHDCARDSNCNGTAEHPCQWVQNWEIGNIGFIAQEVGSVIPEAANIDENGEFTSISPTGMVAIAIAAIKELDSKIESLAERIQKLEPPTT